MPPVNDAFANRITISGATGTQSGTTVDSTTEVGEPLPSADYGDTVWYEWVAPDDGDACFMVDPSSAISGTGLLFFRIYTGTTLGTLVLEEYPGVSNGELGVFLTAVNGTSYKIQVGGYRGPGGLDTEYTFDLQWTLFTTPTNDDLANVEELVGALGSVQGSTVAATTDSPFDPLVEWDGGDGTVWYKIALPVGWTEGQSIIRGTFDQDFDTPCVADSGQNFETFTATVWPPTSLSDVDFQPSGVGGFTYQGPMTPDGFLYIGVGGLDSGAASRSDFTLSWFVDLTPAVRLHDPPVSRFFVTNLDGRTLTILDKRATDRQVTFELDGPSRHTGLVAADDPEINIPFPTTAFGEPAFLSHNTRLIYWLRREMGNDPPYVCRGAWLIMQCDDAAGDAPTTRYTAYDPWQYLFSRPVRDPNNDSELPGQPGVRYPAGTRASAIALDLLEMTEDIDGPTLIDFSDGSLIQNTDTLPTEIVFEQGVSVGEAWQRLCSSGTIDILLRPIYDPEDRPGMLSELVIRRRAGSLKAGAVFAWDKPGRNLTEFSRLIDGTQLANTVAGITGQAGQTTSFVVDVDSIAAYGVYFDQFVVSGGKPGTDALTGLQALASVYMRRDGQRSISFTPAPERSLMVIRDYGLGDYVAVWASKNAREPFEIDYDALDFAFPGAAGYQRVYGFTISFDDNGTERVSDLITSQDTPVGG